MSKSNIAPAPTDTEPTKYVSAADFNNLLTQIQKAQEASSRTIREMQTLINAQSDKIAALEASTGNANKPAVASSSKIPNAQSFEHEGKTYIFAPNVQKSGTFQHGMKVIKTAEFVNNPDAIKEVIEGDLYQKYGSRAFVLSQ